MDRKINRRRFLAGAGAGAGALLAGGPVVLAADRVNGQNPEGVRSNLKGPRLLSAYPVKAYFEPRSKGEVLVEVSKEAVGQTVAQVTLVGLAGPLATRSYKVRERSQVLPFTLPRASGRGYGVRVSLVDSRTHAQVGVTETALDVQKTWVDAPRYGFLSEFAPGESYATRATEMARRHINVVQFYDWMYMHYQYLPPKDPFTNILGRTLSIASVKKALAAIHGTGMAGMAYGSVYGAEQAYALKHKNELLYDGPPPDGNPINLSNIFYLQDVRPGPWRDHILGQYKIAIQKVGFDGIHTDQYGFPTSAYDYKGHLIDMASALSGMVGAAQKSVVGDHGQGIIFNCVTDWPIQQVAPEPQLCMYVEVWPPYIWLQDLSTLVIGARKLAPTRQVILAAYMSCAQGNVDAATAATLLTSAAIHASGGFHLLLGEGTAILDDSYYPNFTIPGQTFQNRLVAHWDFIVRYTAYLFDRSLEYREGEAIQAGGLWAIHRSGETFDTLSLINASPTDNWNQVKKTPPTRRALKVEMPSPKTVSAVFAANPDGGADAVRLPFSTSGGKLRFTAPSVKIWTLVVILHGTTEKTEFDDEPEE